MTSADGSCWEPREPFAAVEEPGRRGSRAVPHGPPVGGDERIRQALAAKPHRLGTVLINRCDDVSEEVRGVF